MSGSEWPSTHASCLLRHRPPRLYQSVDKSYFNKVTDVFNEQYKVEDEKQTDFDNLSDDELMEQMRELERQIAKRKKTKKF